MKGLIGMEGYDCKILYFTSVHHTAWLFCILPALALIQGFPINCWFSLGFDYISDGKMKNFHLQPRKNLWCLNTFKRPCLTPHGLVHFRCVGQICSTFAPVCHCKCQIICFTLLSAVARWHTNSSDPLAVAPGPDFRRRDLSQGGILKWGDLF